MNPNQKSIVWLSTLAIYLSLNYAPWKAIKESPIVGGVATETRILYSPIWRKPQPGVWFPSVLAGRVDIIKECHLDWARLIGTWIAIGGVMFAVLKIVAKGKPKAPDSAIVKSSLEVWLDDKKVPESERPKIREFAKHSISCYTENGEHIKHPLDTEDLLSVLMGMERYIVDSNLADSLDDAKKPENQNKAFILGQTFTDEQEKLEAAILGHDNSNNNLFDFGYVGEEVSWLPSPCFVINRLDVHQRITFDDRLGGEDFTDVLAKIILGKVANDFDIVSVQSDRLTMRRIKDVAEESKLLLSGSESVEVRVPYVKSHRGSLENIVCTVSRTEFEAECAPLLGRMENIVEQVLCETGLTPRQANIWLLGNASRMPAVSRNLRTKFSVKPPSLSDLKTSVVLGAAKVAATLKGLDRHLLLLDVTPRSLGISTRAGDFEPLIRKNATIPTRTTKTFTTVSDNQTTISVPILEEAERESDSHRTIGMLKMENIPACRAGIQKIEVAFDVDPNNILHVSAEVKDDSHAPNAVKVTCNDFELSEQTLNQYHALVQDWIEMRRKRWPKSGA